MIRSLGTFLGLLLGLSMTAWCDPFINFESPHVHPLDLSPDGTLLAACNTPDNRIEFFSLSSGTPIAIGSVFVGLDPVSVRFRTNAEVWAVNHVSDSVSIVDVGLGTVSATITTRDEPCDVVFAGSPARAFVSCSQANTVQVFDPADLDAGSLSDIDINAEDPRALAVSSDGSEVYVAIFESGNRSTILGGGGDGAISFPPNVVDDPNTPHGTMNPHFNGSGVFFPPKDPGNGAAPMVGLIVKQDDSDVWRDDTLADWSAFVSGASAAQSGRPVGWTLIDHDVAVIDTGTLTVSYIDHLMNANMALDVNPVSGDITVVGIDAINEVRFEPVLNGVFVQCFVAFADASTQLLDSLVDLNPHLTYATSSVVQSERDKSLGDPRAIVWNSTGTLAYVAGMGSNNLTVIDATGDRAGLGETIEVQEGPTGLALDETRAQLYVLNKFHSTISVVDLTTEIEVAVLPFFDPSSEAIKQGRKHLYDTRKTSGLGQVSCASCHLDARMDRLSWDLGDPSGAVKSLAGLNLGANISGLNGGFQPFHPMKGPMSTQTLQGIIGQEPFHWRGDRLGLEEFNPAFIGLLGDDTELSETEMQEFEDFLETIFFPPNSFRNLDNTLPTNLELKGHWTTGRFGAAGSQLPNGNAVNALARYRDQNNRLDAGTIACVTCHTLPSGGGTDKTFNGSLFVDIPRNPATNANTVALVSVDGSTNISMKTPHLRNAYDKVGFTVDKLVSRSGFGFAHDGSVPSMERFVGLPVFNMTSDQDIADMTALMMAFSGSDFGVTSPAAPPLEPPGVESRDVHAAVGQQITVDSVAGNPVLSDLLDVVQSDTNNERVEMIAKLYYTGYVRGLLYLEDGTWQSDTEATVITTATLLSLVVPGSEITFTVVPDGSGARLALDRDEDGSFDGDEITNGTNPANPDSDDDGFGDREEIDAGTDPTDDTSVPTAVVWVDYGHSGKETGAQVYPFDTLAEGAAAVNSGGTVKVSPGATSEAVTLSKPMRIEGAI